MHARILTSILALALPAMLYAQAPAKPTAKMTPKK